jgi:hypothetical protein
MRECSSSNILPTDAYVISWRTITDFNLNVSDVAWLWQPTTHFQLNPLFLSKGVKHIWRSILCKQKGQYNMLIDLFCEFFYDFLSAAVSMYFWLNMAERLSGGIRGQQIFKKSRSHLQIPVASRMTWIKFLVEGPTILEWLCCFLLGAWELIHNFCMWEKNLQ